MQACRLGEFVRVMDLLAKGADANYQDYNMSTPLMNAVYGGAVAAAVACEARVSGCCVRTVSCVCLRYRLYGA